MRDYNLIQSNLEEKLTIIVNDLRPIATYDTATDNWEATPDASELNEADSNSEADVIEAWNERRATVAALETEYRDIKRALEKISLGTYGICEISGEPIEEDRLEVHPTARTCKQHMDQEFDLSL